MTSHRPDAEPASPRAARPAAPDRARAAGRPRARPHGLRRSPVVFRVAMILFFIGGLALLVVLAMFASGTRVFPLWLWLTVALAPIGLIVGSIGVGRAGSSLG